ncbi:MAG: PP0621 family protein [Gammaproteobacteria bacterium]|nr:PP0621 family protein [Gammaproteobacteria bacterium]
MDLLADLIIIWFIVLLYRRWTGPVRPRFRPERPVTAGRSVRSGGEMVSCAHCGLYLPHAEALTGADGKTYCSREHARAP